MIRKRVPHRLRSNERDSRPERIIFYDLETQAVPLGDGQTEHRFRLGWACYWQPAVASRAEQVEWYRITDLDQFWRWVTDRSRSRQRLLVVSHNLAFDMLAGQANPGMRTQGFDLQRFYEKNFCLTASFTRDRRKILFVDNMNIFAGSLASWGARVGVAKGEVDFETVTEEELSEYCHRDVEILVALWRWWFEFIDRHAMGSFAVTLAGQAFNAFRHRFLDTPVWIHNRTEAVNMEREAYHGGRAEAFYIGQAPAGRYTLLDINSMYPAMMSAFSYPYDLASLVRRPSLGYLESALERYGVIAEVELECPDPIFPVYRTGRIVFPTGHLTTVLTTREVQLALRRGWIKKVHRLTRYRMDDLFSSYVAYFYSLKQTAERDQDKLIRALSKRLLNSLYGKFGQMRHDFSKIGDCSPSEFRAEDYVHLLTGERSKIYYMAGHVWEWRKAGDAWNAFPAIAAHVTANARLLLWQLIEKAGRRNCYYCDTDSLIVNDEGLERLQDEIAPGVLGKLKVDHSAATLSIDGPKNYTLGDRERHAGIKKSATRTGVATWEQESFTSVLGAAFRGSGYRVVSRKVEKCSREDCTWGELQDDGWVLPFRL